MDEIIFFLETHVCGKSLHTKELLYELEDGLLQGVYSDQISFSNLKYSRTSFSLDMFVISNEKIWQLNECMERQTLRKDFSGVSLFRFELARRKSTSAWTGLFRFVSSSSNEVPAEAIVSGIYDVQFKHNKLTLKEDQVLYRDQPIQNNAFKSVAFQSTHTLFIENGKLHYEYNGQSFDVDPYTMKRSSSSDRFPPFVSIEL